MAAVVCAGTLALHSAAEEGVSAETLYRNGVQAVAQKDYARALRLFREMQSEHPRSARAVRSWEYIAQCENALGNPYAAFEAYQQIWDNHKDFKGLPTITRNQMKIGNYFLKRKRYTQAIEVYETVLRNAPFSDVAAAAQYSLAQAYIAQEDYDAAKSELEKVIRDHATSQLVDDAAFDLGYVDFLQSRAANYDQTATTEAIASFRRFIHNFPSSPKVPQAQQYVQQLRARKAASLFRMGEYYQNIKAPKAAGIAYREVVEQYPDTAYADEARVRLAQVGDADLPKADRARRERQMEELRRGMEDTRAVEAVEQQTLSQQTLLDTTAPAAVPPSGATRVTRTDASLQDGAQQYSRQRVQRIVRDPEARAQLRAQMKEVYTEELKESRVKRKAWEEKRLALLSDSRDRAADVLERREPEQFAPAASTASPAAPSQEFASWSATETAVAPAEPVDDLSMVERSPQPTAPEPAPVSSSSSAGVTPIDDVTWTPVASSSTMTMESDNELVVETSATPAPTATYTAPPAARTTGQRDASALIDEMLEYSPSEQQQRVDVTSAPPPQPVVEERVDTLTVTGTSATTTPAPAPPAPATPAPAAARVRTTRTTSLQETPVDDLPPHLETLVESAETSTRTPAGSASETESVVYQRYQGTPADDAPAAQATRMQPEMPVVMDDARRDALTAAQRAEQQREAEARVRAQTARRAQTTDEGWTTRTMPADTTVRRAKIGDEAQERRATAYDTDALQREYATVYYLIQRGDAAIQQGMYTRAKEHYGDALKRLEEMREKAPTWETDVVNFRIDYCRKQMRSVQ